MCAWGNLLSLSVPQGMGKITDLWFAMGDQYTDWHYGIYIYIYIGFPSRKNVARGGGGGGGEGKPLFLAKSLVIPPTWENPPVDLPPTKFLSSSPPKVSFPILTTI